ncbi:O-antigen ligase family protein [Patescibacteria group bacterium]
MSSRSISYIVYAIKAGLFILPLLCLIVVESLFFPFITGKNFFFRIIVEILLLLWVFVMVFDSKYRPRISPILISLSAVLLFLSLATIFGESPYRSFWSNYERMEGLVSHVHLFLYFLILTSIFQSQKEWKQFFGVVLGANVLLVGYGFLQLAGKAAIHQSGTRLDASFGNSGYLAIYLIFGIFVTALFLYWFKNFWLRLGLATLLILEALIVFFTATRGAILGLFGGLILFSVLMSIFSKNKPMRVTALALLTFLVIILSLFFVFRNAQFMSNNYVLARLSTMTVEETTIQSRLTIWGMSWEGFKEHPILGWGPENYNLVFNKYYKPELFRQEPWFDRSHNIVFDWLISSGILGFLAYISIFTSTFYMIWRKKFDLFQTSLIVSLFAAYLFHNLFVFDNLTSYFMFFSVLGYIHTSSFEKEKESVNKKDIPFSSYFVVTFVFCLVVFSLYFVNAKPIMAANSLLRTLILQRQPVSAGVVVDKYDEVFSFRTFGSGEAREQLSGFANNVVVAQDVSVEDKNLILGKAIEQMELQVEAFPKQTRYRVFLGALYSRGMLIDESLKMLLSALELSPNKQHISFAVADAYLSYGQKEKALEILQKTYELSPVYSEAAKNYVMVSIIVNLDNAQVLLNQMMKIFGEDFRYDKKFISAYAQVGEYGKVKEIWEYQIKLNPENLQYYLNLAATQVELGEREGAIKQIEYIISVQPNFKEQGGQIIRDIRAGKTF